MSVGFRAATSFKSEDRTHSFGRIISTKVYVPPYRLIIGRWMLKERDVRRWDWIKLRRKVTR
jgi:hypothetical protein